MMPEEEMPQGSLAQAKGQPMPGDPTTPDETQAHEGAEGGDFESAEGADEGGGGEGKTYTPQEKELFSLLVARTMKALTGAADDLDKALKADPVRATVEFGTSALRTVVMAAQDAGQEPSLDIVAQAGMQVIKELAGIASDKGYLPDEQIDTFLKECFQQSMSKYAKMDSAEGILKQEDLDKASGRASGEDKAKVAGAAGAQAQDRVQGSPLMQAKGM